MTNSTDDRLSRIEAIIEANATAIAQLQQTMDSGFEQTRQRTAELQQTMDSGFEQTRQVIEREATEAISLISGLAEHQEETDIRFNNLLQEARADRQRNENEHQAFRESFQNMLAEIARIWQRLAG